MKHDKTSRKGILKLSPVTWIGLALVLALMMFNGYSLGKYMKEYQKEPLYVAQNFYFESDLLRMPDNTGTIPGYTLKSGAEAFSFELRNYTDQLRCSEVAITYTVTVTDEAGKPVQTGITGSIAGDECNTAEVAVPLSELPAGTYTVTADSAPYDAQLKAEFTVVDTAAVPEITVTDFKGAPTLQLTIEAKDWAGTVRIGWPDGVLPDNSDPLMETAVGANGGTHAVTVQKDSSYTFVFFKKDPSAEYRQESFTLSWDSSIQ